MDGYLWNESLSNMVRDKMVENILVGCGVATLRQDVLGRKRKAKSKVKTRKGGRAHVVSATSLFPPTRPSQGVMAVSSLASISPFLL